MAIDPCKAQSAPFITGDARVDRLLGQMTLAEKMTLIHDGREDPRQYQGQAGYIGGIERLGIPGLRLADGPPGVLTRVPAQAETATMGVAASFDVELARLNGVVIGREARSLGIDISLQPFINIDRDLSMRRLYNTFGEDPLLTGAMGAATMQLRLNWYAPAQRDADHAAAIEAARHAKVAVVFAWARRSPAFVLPGDQERLIEEIATVNPNTIVVLNTSQPVALPWAGRVKAILEMWWPGDEGGWATAKLLLGRLNPAGRLPVTWALRLQDYAAADPRFPERSAQGVDHRTTYSEGINVGYRWFDHEQIQPLFPFGHGLSYTRFDYSGLRLVRTAKGDLRVTFNLKNSGARAGDEVAQVYLGAPELLPPGSAFATRKLVAFDRVHLAAGQSKTLRLVVPLRQLQYWSASMGAWRLAEGERRLSVGASSRALMVERLVRIEQ